MDAKSLAIGTVVGGTTVFVTGFLVDLLCRRLTDLLRLCDGRRFSDRCAAGFAIGVGGVPRGVVIRCARHSRRSAVEQGRPVSAPA